MITPPIRRMLTLGRQARPVHVEDWTLLFREERPHLLHAFVWTLALRAKRAALFLDGAGALRVALLLSGFELGAQLLGAPSNLQLGFDDRVHPARLLCAELDAGEERHTRMSQPLLPQLGPELASLATPLGPPRSRRRIADPGIRAVRRFPLRQRRRLRVRGAHSETDAGDRNQDCDCTAQAYRTHYRTP